MNIHNLKWSPMMQEIIEEKRKHLQLYEGLITSYPIEQVMQIIVDKLNKLKKNI
jgi:hypothetical protein